MRKYLVDIKLIFEKCRKGSTVMELGNQIKKYRGELKLSQDALAEKIFVSRQTISNWENEKNYPDISSLVRLSEVFGVSVDVLLKGDVEEMKKIINQDDINEFNRMSWVYTILFFLLLFTAVPFLKFMGGRGIALWCVQFAATMWYALKVEKKKKELNIQTYREISAFLEGKTLDEIEAAREEAKRPYQKILLGIVSGVVALIVMIIMMYILD